MGCDHYHITGHDGAGWVDMTVKVSEAQEDLHCLCSFDGRYITPETVRSLAYLGAAMALAHNGKLTGEWQYLPGDLPEGMRQEIDALIRGLG